MGKGFKLPGKLPGPPVKIAMPAVQSGGSYRNPAMIIDRSAEILGAGIQEGMNKIGDALKQKAMDKMAEEKGQEPQSNVDKEIQKEKLDSFADKSQAILDSGVVIDAQAFPEFDTVNAKGLKSSFLPMVDDELAAVGAPVDLPETPLNMKEESPNKFLGAAAGAALGTRSSGSAGGFNVNNLVQDGKFIGFGGVADMLKQNQTQAQQAAAASTAAGGTMGTANQNPMTGSAIPEGGGKFQLTPVAMSYDPPLQANEKGGKKSIFNLNTKGMAETAFGTPAMRQASVGAPFQSNAFYAALNDAKEKGAKTFEVGGKTFNVQNK